MIYVLGGGGLSKCSIIVHIDSGSAVAAYSNAAATTKVKDAKEIGTSGDYLITGLPTGTYYVKATKAGKTAISSAIAFTDYGIEDVVLSYALIIWKNGDGLTAFQSTFTKVYGNPSSALATNGNVIMTFPTYGDSQVTIASANSYNVSDYSALEINAKINSDGPGAMGIADSRRSDGGMIAKYAFSSAHETNFTVRRVTIPSTTSSCYISFVDAYSATIEVESIRFVR